MSFCINHVHRQTDRRTDQRVSEQSLKLNKRPSLARSVAFTLAEVLIVLGILGIIAELTIPTVLHDVKNKEYVAMFKQSYALWSQALGLMKINNGGFSILGAYATTDAALDEFCTVLKCTRKCYTTATSADKAQCFHAQSDWRKLDKTTGWEDYSTIAGYASGQLVNGMTFAMSKYSDATCANTNGVCINFVIDTNGPKMPNTMGRDMYFFNFLKDKLNVVGGANDWAYYPTNKNYCNPSVAGVDYSGCNCAGRLILEGEMNY